MLGVHEKGPPDLTSEVPGLVPDMIEEAMQGSTGVNNVYGILGHPLMPGCTRAGWRWIHQSLQPLKYGVKFPEWYHRWNMQGEFSAPQEVMDMAPDRLPE